MDINSEKIQALRDAKAWSQDELATAAGLSVRTIQRAEREGVASLQTIKAIAAAFQVDSTTLRPPKTPAGQTELESAVSTAPSNKRRFVVAGIVALVVGAVLVGLFAKRFWTSPRPEELPLAERILGHWESSTSGRVTTLDMDGKQTNTGGAVKGNSVYTLQGDIISFGFRNQIVSMRITFDSNGEMDWTGVRTGYVAHYGRKRIVMPSRETVLAGIVGKWRGTGDIKSLEIDSNRLRMEWADGKVIDAPLLLIDLEVTVKHDGTVDQYAVTIDSPTQMTWNPVYTPVKYKLTRVDD